VPTNLEYILLSSFQACAIVEAQAGTSMGLSMINKKVTHSS
jgi:hypothetical protein